MAKTSWTAIDDELLIFVRNNATDPKSRPTTTSEDFSGNASDVDFTLTNNPVQNVRTITIGGASQTFGTDYIVAYRPGNTVVTFTSAPGSGTNNITVTYDYGKKWVYPDIPQETLKLDSYPRIGIVNVSSPMVQLGFGTGITQTSMLKDIIIYGENENQINTILNELKNAILNNKDQFFYFDFIQPVGVSPIIKEGGRHEKIISRNFSLEIPFLFES